jgi:hypothetical protein
MNRDMMNRWNDLQRMIAARKRREAMAKAVAEYLQKR